MEHKNQSHKNHHEEAHGADKHEGHRVGSFLRKFWVVLVLTIPILIYSEIFEIAFSATPPEIPGKNIFIGILGSIIFFYGGGVFLKGARRELQARMPGMMTLIALAIVAAYAFSVFSIIRGAEHTLFWELSTLIAIMLLGHWIEMRAVQGTKGALRELAKLLPDTAEVMRNGTPVVIPLEELKSGDIVLVKPGGKVPADGIIKEGKTDLNESVLTGESKPVQKGAGDEVIAGSINGDGSITVAITKIGEETFLAGVMRLVKDVEASKSRLQILSDRAAFYLTVIAIAAGGTTFIVWLFAKAGIVFATERLVAVLVVACPHALGLAVPLVASISTTMAARNGFLVRDRRALEAARSITTVLFDKTGTLTKGEFGVDAIIPTETHREEEVLQIAASANSVSEHPLAKAMVQEAVRKKSALLKVKDFRNIPGKGAEAQVEGKRTLVGNEAIVNEAAIAIPESLREKVNALTKQGKTTVYVVHDGELLGGIALVDVIREESREAIAMLHELGVTTAMVTGDSEEVAAWVAKELGIKEFFARVFPDEKANIIKKLQESTPTLKSGSRSRFASVGMVGDGVNDAPALTQADVGIAIGAGTNVAIESAGIILVRNDPRDIPKIIQLSRLTYAKMIQNLFWATGYNVVALPLAAGVLAAKGIILEPALAAVFMSVSTVIVAINAVLLRRKKL